MTDNESVGSLKAEEPGNISGITVVNIEDGDTPSTVPAQPAEKKLTAKQLEKLKEKEERERKRLEEKLSRERAKEEEKRLKEEKRQQQLLERQKKQEEKDRIKRENELKREQLRKEREEKERLRQEEKLKKEQEKLQREQEKKLKEEQEKKKKDKLKISNFFKPRTSVKSTSVLAQQQQQEHHKQQGLDQILKENDYHRLFKPFFIREGVTLVPNLSKERLTESVDDFDKALEKESSQGDLSQWFSSLPVLKEEGNDNETTAQYIYENGLTNAPIRIKFIKFYESVKSWTGSYTQSCYGLGSDPLRTLDKEFIDFDDVIDEDEDGEGEDIDDEDEDEDEDEDDEDEMTDFLEEDNNGGTNGEQRKKIIGPLIPVITWGKSDQSSAGCIKFEVLKPNVSLPLDPFCNYWQTQQQQSNGGNIETPLKKKSKTMITVREDLEKFADKVHDCEFSIPTMVEILKKELPNYTKITIENTLRSLATKVGSKQTEKKWQVDRDSLNRLCSLESKE